MRKISTKNIYFSFVFSEEKETLDFPKVVPMQASFFDASSFAVERTFVTCNARNLPVHFLTGV